MIPLARTAEESNFRSQPRGNQATKQHPRRGGACQLRLYGFHRGEAVLMNYRQPCPADNGCQTQQRKTGKPGRGPARQTGQHPHQCTKKHDRLSTQALHQPGCRLDRQHSADYHQPYRQSGPLGGRRQDPAMDAADEDNEGGRTHGQCLGGNQYPDVERHGRVISSCK